MSESSAPNPYPEVKLESSNQRRPTIINKVAHCRATQVCQYQCDQEQYRGPPAGGDGWSFGQGVAAGISRHTT